MASVSAVKKPMALIDDSDQMAMFFGYISLHIHQLNQLPNMYLRCESANVAVEEATKSPRLEAGALRFS